jgi:hypothetical protein
MKINKWTNEIGTPLIVAIRRTIERQEIPSQVELNTERSRTMKYKSLLAGFFLVASHAAAQHSEHTMPKEMQHGFVLSANDTFASHLVARGHHSRQTEITGQLVIEDETEMNFYKERKLLSSGGSYFIFQAQHLDLPTISSSQTLTGHIIESKIGGYEPENNIVKSAVFKIESVILNIPNPFFIEKEKIDPFRNQEWGRIHNLRNPLPTSDTPNVVHCCDSGVKPCNWKC